MNKYSGNNIINFLKKLSKKDFIDGSYEDVNKKITSYSTKNKGEK